MARHSDSELKDLKDRANAAWVSGSHLAHAELHLIDLIAEVLELRNGGKKNALKEKAPEAPKAAPEAPKAPEKEPEDDKSVKDEADDADKASKLVKPSKKK